MDWVRAHIPTDAMGAHAWLTERCRWKVRSRSDGDWDVCLEERWAGRPPDLVSVVRLIDRRGEDPTAMSRLATVDLGALYDDLDQAAVRAEMERFAASGAREDFWASFRLAVTATAPASMPDTLRTWIKEIQKELPKASIWHVRLTDVFVARQAAVRPLFASTEIPEVFDPTHDFKGINSVKGLQGTGGYGIGPRLDPAFTICAPWVIGLSASRVGGAVALLFGSVEAGRRDRGHAELIDLLRPDLIKDPAPGTAHQPDLAPDDVVSLLRWWIGRLNLLYGVEFDPSTYAVDGRYQPVRQVGVTLTLDRLFASVQTILVASRRDDFVRLTFLFDTLDLLAGLGLGDRHDLLNAKRVRQEVARLAAALPAGAARVILPRCERAVAALEAVGGGFWLSERVRSDGVRLPAKNGGEQWMPMDQAIAQFLSAVRNATHGLGRELDQPLKRALMTLHDGEIPTDLADVALIHLLAMLVDPDRLRPRQLRRTARS